MISGPSLYFFLPNELGSSFRIYVDIAIRALHVTYNYKFDIFRVLALKSQRDYNCFGQRRSDIFYDVR